MANTKQKLNFRREVEHAVESQLKDISSQSTGGMVATLQEVQQQNADLREELSRMNDQLVQEREGRIMQVNRMDS